MRDVEIHLVDQCGKNVVLRETVALSDSISQPILCFGKLLENGWGVNGIEQTLAHGSVSVPVEMQNRSMSVRGWIRVIKDDPNVFPNMMRMVKAEIFGGMDELRVGWHLNAEGVGVGKHFSDCFQDPSTVVPNMSGVKFRTTLVEDRGQWIALELCEDITGIVDLSAKFFEPHGNRFIVTITTDSERPPQAKRFRLLNDSDVPQGSSPPGGPEVVAAEVAPLAPEDEEIIGAEIVLEQQQDEFQPGQIVIAEPKDDSVTVNGVEIFRDSALATMRTACEFCNIAKSGGKKRCFQRLWDFQKQLELQAVMGAARNAEAEMMREPRPQNLAKAPTDLEVMKHNLTHLPFADWCDSCIAHRARQDMHQRDGSSRASGVPTISFDFAYTKASVEGQQVKEVESLCTLVMVDSSTAYFGCIPVANKNQFAMMVREVLNFTQVLGHSEVIYRCDKELSLKQLQDLLVRARQQLGLATRKAAPAAYSHGNSLCEN